MNKIPIILITTLLLCNCSKQKNVEVIKTTTFKTNFIDVYWRFKGIYFDRSLNKDVVYFSDFGKTCVIFFDLLGNKIDSVSLKNAQNIFIRKEMAFIYPYSRDTIFCGEHLNNKIAVIDNKGIIFHIIDFYDILPDSVNRLYYFNNRNNPFQEQTSNTLLLHPILNYYELLFRENMKTDNLLDGHKYYFEKFQKAPYFFEANNIFSNAIECRFLNFDFYEKYFSENDAAKSQDVYFKQINNYIFVFFNSKHLLLKINPQNYEILEEINIYSQYTDMGFSYTFGENINKSEKKNKALYQGRIIELFHNKQDKKYYAIIMYGVKNKGEYIYYNEFDYRPFSIIIYDENFENQKEYAFEGNKYICRNSFMSQEGLWIQRKPEKLTKENYGTQTFDLLRFD